MNSLVLEDGQTAQFYEPNASGVALVNKTIRQIKEIKVDNKITKLILGDEIEIKIGDDVHIEINERVVRYKINHIIKSVTDGVYILKEFIENESKYFLTPMYGGVQYTWYYNGFFTNAYQSIIHPGKWKYDGNNVLYLVYRFSPSPEYLKLENTIMNHPQFLYKYDKIGTEDRFVVYIMNIPEEFRKDVIRLNKGKYKYFSKELKDKIKKFHQLKPDSTISQVLDNNPELRKKMEVELGCEIPKHLSLRSKPNLVHETYG